MKENIVLIGYSGHAFVVYDVLLNCGYTIDRYCEKGKVVNNPFELNYLGDELCDYAIDFIKKNNFFVAIGDNIIRKKIMTTILSKVNYTPVNAICNTSKISKYCNLGHGVFVNSNVMINAFSSVGNGVVCNTGAIIEHEVEIGDFCHIAPGAVICGAAKIGENTFIGANAVVRQGVVIGNNVTVGAGTVVLKDIESNAKVVGNPQKRI